MLSLVLASCGGAAGPGAAYPQDVPFQDHESVSQADLGQSTPAIAVAVDAGTKAELDRIAGSARPVPEGRLAIAVFQGDQRTGGYTVRVERVTLRTAATLEVHAVFTSPAADAVVTQVLTSPAHIVTVARADVSGVDRVVLLDQAGEQRASVTVPIR
ncbi:MAG: protease complex subunit PrcB family protein [Candidatus Limnocylindria bacterium]